MKIDIQRVYDASPVKEEAFRVLVDRLWPRGVKKENLELDLWAKDISPSSALREKFHHQPNSFSDFKKQYVEELDNNELFAHFVEEISKHPKVLFLYSSKDQEHNNAVVLKAYIESKLS
ncbi:DUF488 domain-containing protein [Pseudopedobacter beijingensis]|uniref:DUF488 domain-containing protein n=1 Tax=Pseudopedobacter beijingensis TaxID=1207056 RepID=A0ABW4IBW1_9SPHI